MLSTISSYLPVPTREVDFLESSVCTFASLFFFFQEMDSVLIDIASLLLCDSHPKSILLQYYSGYIRSASRGCPRTPTYESLEVPRCSGHWSLARPLQGYKLCMDVIFCRI